MPFYSPLRYPGGKRRLSNFIKALLISNELDRVHYVEPYAGGAAVALALLFNEYADHIHINDLSRSLYAFWFSVVNDTEALCTRIKETEVSISEWHRQRAIQKDLCEAPLLDLAFSTFFLNRTNRSGILTGGVIGGQHQNGEFKLNARYNSKDLIDRIKRVAHYRNRINVYNLDAVEFIKQIDHMIPPNSFLFLDPPYFATGKDLYQNNYRFEDHVRVAKTVASLNHHEWIVTYDHSPEIVQLYRQFRTRVYSLRYSAANRYSGSEVMIMSDGLTLPNITNPSKVSNQTILKMRVVRDNGSQ